LDSAQEVETVDDAGQVLALDCEAATVLGAYREVERLVAFIAKISERMVAADPTARDHLNAHCADVFQVIFEHIAWQAKSRNRQTEHSADFVLGFENGHVVVECGKIVGACQTASGGGSQSAGRTSRVCTPLRRDDDRADHRPLAKGCLHVQA